jgi:hypothetical protein
MTCRLHAATAVLMGAFFYLPNQIAGQSISPASRKFISIPKNAIRDGKAVLWRQPTDIPSLDMLNGKGGKANLPRGPFTYLKEKMDGTSPKFTVRDSIGSKWKVKLGPEAKPETAATRLLWAVGYFTDEDFFLPEITVRGMKKLTRGQEYVSRNGTVRGARLERQVDGRKVVGHWGWNDSPFVKTKEFNGLAIMMALINNWDLKTGNNAIIRVGKEYEYRVSDLGAAFGNAGVWGRSKGDLQGYRRSKFVKNVSGQKIDLRLPTRPPLKYILAFPFYLDRAKLANLTEDLPETDVEWIGHLLSRLSSRQIADAFRAGGFKTDEVKGFAEEVRKRIEMLHWL